MSWGKNSCTEKNIYLTAYNAAKNMLHHLIYVWGKNSTSTDGLRGKSLTQTKSNPLQPTKSSGRRLRSAKLNYQPQFGETEPATRERERKKSRLGQTQFDDFNKCLKYTWFSTYFYWQMSSLI